MTSAGHGAVFVLTVIIQSSVYIHTSDVTPSCNYTLTTTRGVIRSPNYPHPYPGGVTCQWHITVGNNVNAIGLTLAIKHYSTQETNSGRLFEEELLIYEENPSFSNATPVVYTETDDVYQSQQQELWLRFSSAPNIGRKSPGPNVLGFDILYSAVIPGDSCPSRDSPETPLNASVVGNSTVGSFISYSCSRGFRLDGARVTVCVLGESGQPTWSDPAPSCLDTCKLPAIPNGNTQYLDLKVNSTLTFFCDSPYVVKGGDTIKCILDNRGIPAWNRSSIQCVIPDCSNRIVLTQWSGAIVNPGYATSVINADVSCSWQVVAEVGRIIHLSFLYFDLPAGSTLEVTDTGRERRLIVRLVGGDAPRNVTSQTNVVELEYHGPARNSTDHQGFYIQYQMGSLPIILDDERRGSRTPNLPPITTTPPVTSPKPVTTYVDDDSGTVKIAVGVGVPVFICLVVILGLYLWYRKKYPVRMIIGREFGKFYNPEYATKATSTLTLVREDAEDFFNIASRATSNVSLVMDKESGPHYVNVAFTNDHDGVTSGELDDTEHQPLDQDAEDRELMKRKSYLFTHMDMFDGDEDSRKEEDSSSDSGSVSHSDKSHTSRRTQDVVVTVEQEQEEEQEHVAAIQTEVNISQSDGFSTVGSNLNNNFPHRKLSLSALIERSRDRRAFTNEEPKPRRLSYDASMSVRGRSLSAKTPGEVTLEAEKLTALLNMSKGSCWSRSLADDEEDEHASEAVDNTPGHLREISSDNEENQVENQSRGAVYGDSVDNMEVRNVLQEDENVSVSPESTVVATEEDRHEQPNKDGETEDLVNIQDGVYEKIVVKEGHVSDGELPLVVGAPVEGSEPEQDITGRTDETDADSSGKEETDSIVSHTKDGQQYSSVSDSEREFVLKDEIDSVTSQPKNDSEKEYFARADVDLVDPNDTRHSATAPGQVSDPNEESSQGAPDTVTGKSVESSDEDDQLGVDVHVKTASPRDPPPPVSELSREFDRTDIPGEGVSHTHPENVSDSSESDKPFASSSGLGHTDDEEKVQSHPESVTLVSTSFHDGEKSDGHVDFRPTSNSFKEDDSEDDSVSESSTSSNVSGRYDFGNPVQKSDDEDEGERGGEKEVGRDIPHPPHSPDSADGVVAFKQQEDDEDRSSVVSGFEPKKEAGINLDTSSISSLDPSLLDTSVELSTSSTESPVPQKRFSHPPTTSDQPRKVLAPVFTIGDDDDDTHSDASSDSEEEDKPRASISSIINTINPMPGIEEESDSDEGRSRSYNISGVGDDASESEEEGLQFTDDDLLAELSDGSSKDGRSDSSHNVKLTPGTFVFGDPDDDIDV
ncbi:dentin sialophosphoprotein-like [Haliotis asinina]|uniref:dentin sialophosphoprotein-like n=1 Tax=Haliotis asinina TaxID=109174 RepID=UPI0035319DDB